MHRWLCTTAPLLIGSIAVGTIHAAPTSDSCPRIHPQAGQQGSRDADYLRTLAATVAFDPLRACTGCHDGTVARSDIDMRIDVFAGGGQAGFVPVRFDARP